MFAFCIFVVVGYVVATTAEWMFHRYCMHHTDNDIIPGKALKGINRRHRIHHNVTNTDMTVRPAKDKYKKHGLEMHLEPFQGLYFLWPATIGMSIGAFIGSLIINFVLNLLLSPVMEYNVSYTTAMVAALAVVGWISCIWNWLHPTLHHARGLKLSEGLDLLPRMKWMENTAVYNYLWKHHVLHHFLVGENAGNFNVTLPGADWLYGTLHTECAGYTLDVENKKIYKSG